MLCYAIHWMFYTISLNFLKINQVLRQVIVRQLVIIMRRKDQTLYNINNNYATSSYE